MTRNANGPLSGGAEAAEVAAVAAAAAEVERSAEDVGVPAAEVERPVAEGGAELDAPSPVAAADAGDPAGDSAGREPGDIVLALSPRQILGGFALLAGLIIMLRRRRRKG